jgi:hypothetical protein
MFQSIMPDAARHGLKRIAVIRHDDSDPATHEYLNGISENLKKLGLTQQYFGTFKEATDWIAQLNEQASINVSK